jgi:hypothetical protein
MTPARCRSSEVYLRLGDFDTDVIGLISGMPNRPHALVCAASDGIARVAGKRFLARS